LAGISSQSNSNIQRYLRLPNQINYTPDSHRYVNHTPEVQRVFERLLETAPRNKEIIGKERDVYGIRKRNIRVLDPNEPSPTITSIPDDFVHYSEPRVMTARECARLQSFPDWFEFKGPYTTGGKLRVKKSPRYTQIGNAVPPLFAEQIGLALIRVLTND
jgi:DNA (cytosine-5)-methyltransferase 1